MKTALRISGLVSLLLCLAVSGCATVPTSPTSLTQQCAQQLKTFQHQVKRYQVTDAQAQPVPGFATYRSNRFWASFAGQTLDATQQRYWRYQLHSLGMQGLAIEWSNLPQSAKDSLLQEVDLITFDDFKQRCGEILFVDSLDRPLPATSVQVEDSYNDWQRVLGLYALTKYGAAGSIAQYQTEMRGYFDSFQAGNLQQTRQYRPANARSDSIDWAEQLTMARSANPLSIPELKPLELQQWAQRFAPVFRIEQNSMADRPGAAGWQKEQRQINGEQPVVYFNPSYIRYQHQLLLQLNYTIWFSERPKPTRYDWYGGKLDGLVWRVTLNPDGTVLFFDSIHPCGCYHSVHLPQGSVLTQKLTKANQDPPLEPILFFQTRIADSVSRVVLSVAANTHYLIDVAAATQAPGEDEGQLIYNLEGYDRLRALPTGETSDPSATKSWFDADGIISSSARFERFFLWPLGVPSAGAMRQQGHHAIAFVGKRHFDEPSVEALLDL